MSADFFHTISRSGFGDNDLDRLVDLFAESGRLGIKYRELVRKIEISFVEHPRTR